MWIDILKYWSLFYFAAVVATIKFYFFPNYPIPYGDGFYIFFLYGAIGWGVLGIIALNTRPKSVFLSQISDNFYYFLIGFPLPAFLVFGFKNYSFISWVVFGVIWWYRKKYKR